MAKKKLKHAKQDPDRNAAAVAAYDLVTLAAQLLREKKIEEETVKVFTNAAQILMSVNDLQNAMLDLCRRLHDGD